MKPASLDTDDGQGTSVKLLLFSVVFDFMLIVISFLVWLQLEKDYFFALVFKIEHICSEDRRDQIRTCYQGIINSQ